MDFHEAHNQLHRKGSGTPMQSRKIQRNTYLERLGKDAIALLLHSTYIAVFYSDGSVILDTGGWHTVTTRDRLGHVSGWHVFSGRYWSHGDSHWWLISTQRSEWWHDRNEKRAWVPFFNGIHLHQHTGEVLSADEEIERAMEDRNPGPTRSERIKDYLTLITNPSTMARIPDKPTKPMQPRQMAYAMLEDYHIDMAVIYEALKVDIARRGELHRSPESETLQWLDMMSKGQEPPRVRSIIRNFLAFAD